MNTAFFFQSDNLLLPADCTDSQIDKMLPLELADKFIHPDIFFMPAMETPYNETQPAPLYPDMLVVSVPTGEPLPENWKIIPVRQILALLGTTCGNDSPLNLRASGILRACHISQWRNESRFCGSCGAENQSFPNLKNGTGDSNHGVTPHRICPSCGRTEFPRICPAIIVVITDEKNRILLAHNKRFRNGIYSHISGFTEAGESLEQTVVREISEEINIKVKNIEYLKSQPWPFPCSLMIGFKAEYLSGEIKPDGDEIEDAGWFTKDNLPSLPAEGSLSRFLINRWICGVL